MKFDGVIVLNPSGLESFFRQWVIMLTPFHGLTGKLVDIYSLMLLWRWRRSIIDDNPAEVDSWFFERDTKAAFMEETGLSMAYYSIILKKLRLSGVLKGNRFNLRYVPRVNRDSGRFDLLIRFDFDGGIFE